MQAFKRYMGRHWDHDNIEKGITIERGTWAHKLCPYPYRFLWELEPMQTIAPQWAYQPRK